MRRVLIGTPSYNGRIDGGVLAPESVLYLANLTTPVTEFGYVVAAAGGIIYDIGSVNGLIGSDTGNSY